MDPNPYRPLQLEASDGEASESSKGRSVWVRNALSLCGCVTGYSVFTVTLALADLPVTVSAIAALSFGGGIAAAWANLPLADQLGWRRGGLPVVFVAFFTALTVYCSVSLLLGTFLHTLISPNCVVLPPASGQL